MGLEKQLLQRIIEGALMAAGQPLSSDRLLTLFVNEAQPPSREELLECLRTIQSSCEGRGFELRELSSGWRFQVCKESAPWVNQLWDEKPQKYSRALLETLALIAYRQPITRGDIEEIRGVAVSSHIIKTLSERDWIKVVGHRDVPGRPSLYATTRQFLDYFNLRSLEQLPSLGEIQDLESLAPELDLQAGDQQTQGTSGIEASAGSDGAVENSGLEAEDADSSGEPADQPVATDVEAVEPEFSLQASDSGTDSGGIAAQELFSEEGATPVEREDGEATEIAMHEPEDSQVVATESDDTTDMTETKEAGSLFPASTAASVFDEP